MTYLEDPDVQHHLQKAQVWPLELTTYIDRRPTPANPEPVILKGTDLGPLLDAIERSDGGEGGSAGGKLLTLCNPTTGPWLGTTPTMLAEFRVLAPFQSTRPHRHTSLAVQYTVEGAGYSRIDGKVYQWEAGDVVIYPAWSTHELCNAGESRVVLFNVLDVPILEAMGHLDHENISVDGPLDPTQVAPPSRLSWGRKKRSILVREGPQSAESPGPRPVVVPHSQLGHLLTEIAGDSKMAGCYEVLRSDVSRRTALANHLSVKFCVVPPGAQLASRPHEVAGILYAIEGNGQLVLDGVHHEFGGGDLVAVPRHRALEIANDHQTEPLILYSVTDWPLLESAAVIPTTKR